MKLRLQKGHEEMATSRYKYKVFEYKKCIRKKEFEIKRERKSQQERNYFPCFSNYRTKMKKLISSEQDTL